MRHVSPTRFWLELERLARSRATPRVDHVAEAELDSRPTRLTVPGTVRLDGAPGHVGLGAASYFLHSPLAAMTLGDTGWTLHLLDQRVAATEPFDARDPFHPLRRAHELFRADGAPPAAGALTGYATYELGERLMGFLPRPLDAPQALFYLHDRVARRVEGGWEVASAGVKRETIDARSWVRRLPKHDLEPTGPGSVLSTAQTDLAPTSLERANRDIGATPETATRATPAVRLLESSLDEETYRQAVTRIRSYIAAGDIYQANLTRMLSVAVSLQPHAYYDALRRAHAAPFACYVVEPAGAAIVGISPELFVSLDGSHVATQPIKGTRPRGATPAEDAALREELWRSEKDAAELVMIVDLMRNDLGRVAAFHSVDVTTLKRIDAHPTLFHLSGRVEAELRPGADIFDLLGAALPAGSITGAPKRRAMEILRELEPHARGVYTGAVGMIDFSGHATFNVAIRTMRITGDRGVLGVGGGIVADSEPQAELEETLTKARAFFLPTLER